MALTEEECLEILEFNSIPDSLVALRKRYHSLSLKIHPDRVIDQQIKNESEEKQKSLNEAYSILSKILEKPKEVIDEDRSIDSLFKADKFKDILKNNIRSQKEKRYEQGAKANKTDSYKQQQASKKVTFSGTESLLEIASALDLTVDELTSSLTAKRIMDSKTLYSLAYSLQYAQELVKDKKSFSLEETLKIAEILSNTEDQTEMERVADCARHLCNTLELYTSKIFAERSTTKERYIQTFKKAFELTHHICNTQSNIATLLNLVDISSKFISDNLINSPNYDIIKVSLLEKIIAYKGLSQGLTTIKNIKKCILNCRGYYRRNTGTSLEEFESYFKEDEEIKSRGYSEKDIECILDTVGVIQHWRETRITTLNKLKKLSELKNKILNGIKPGYLDLAGRFASYLAIGGFYYLNGNNSGDEWAYAFKEVFPIFVHNQLLFPKAILALEEFKYKKDKIKDSQYPIFHLGVEATAYASKKLIEESIEYHKQNPEENEDEFIAGFGKFISNYMDSNYFPAKGKKKQTGKYTKQQKRAYQLLNKIQLRGVSASRKRITRQSFDKVLDAYKRN